MPVGAPRVTEGFMNGFFEFSVPVHVQESVPMVLEGRFGKVRDRQQELERKLRPEVFDG